MMADIKHLRACWPTNYINASTCNVARWCGWSLSEVLDKLLAMRSAGEIKGEQPNGIDGALATSADGHPIYLWEQPDGACGLMPVENPRLLLIGITRAHSEGRRVIYQGARPLEVHRAAAREGLSLRGYSLCWRGPDPIKQPQLQLPVGVVLS